MPLKKAKALYKKTTTVCRERKKPLILLLIIAVLTGIAERFGENLFQRKNENISTTTQNFYMNKVSEENQKITCPFCYKEIQFNSVITHTATSLPKQPKNHQKE